MWRCACSRSRTPCRPVLKRYGATEAEDVAVHALLDDLATRAERGGMYAPSFGGFVAELSDRFPSMRGNKEFVSLVLDTLKVDRLAYRSYTPTSLVRVGRSGPETRARGTLRPSRPRRAARGLRMGRGVIRRTGAYVEADSSDGRMAKGGNVSSMPLVFQFFRRCCQQISPQPSS